MTSARSQSVTKPRGRKQSVAGKSTTPRANRTGDKTRRTGKELVTAFVSHVPASEKAYAATRDAKALDKKLKNLRTNYVVALKEASGSGASTAEKEEAIVKFGGAVLFGMAKSVFEN
eukprot:contig_22422_g5534